MIISHIAILTNDGVAARGHLTSPCFQPSFWRYIRYVGTSARFLHSMGDTFRAEQPHARTQVLVPIISPSHTTLLGDMYLNMVCAHPAFSLTVQSYASWIAFAVDANAICLRLYHNRNDTPHALPSAACIADDTPTLRAIDLGADQHDD